MHLRHSGGTAIMLAGLCSLLLSLVAGATHAAETFSSARIRSTSPPTAVRQKRLSVNSTPRSLKW